MLLHRLYNSPVYSVSHKLELVGIGNSVQVTNLPHLDVIRICTTRPDHPCIDSECKSLAAIMRRLTTSVCCYEKFPDAQQKFVH